MDRAEMTDTPTAPSPERQPADAGGELWSVGSWLSAALDDPKVCPEMKRDIQEWFDGNGHVRAPAPQAQPDARAVEDWKQRLHQMIVDCEADPDDALMLSSSVAAEHAADLRTALQHLSAPAADDGWRPISDYDGCGPVLVSTAPESPKYLFSEPVSAFHDAGGTWRCLGSKGGMAETALRPTHFRPLPAPPVALHPAAPADEVGK